MGGVRLECLLAVLTNGGYALLCTLTGTWNAAAPSTHVMCMALATIGAFMIAIVLGKEVEK